MQIKTTVRWHYIPIIDWLKFKRPVPSIGEDVEYLELSYLAEGNVKWYASFGGQLGHFLKVKDTSTIRSCRSTLRCLPRELKTNVHTKACTRMVMAALFLNSPKLERILNTWRDKLLSSNVKNVYCFINSMNESQTYAVRKKPDKKVHTVHTVWFHL